MAVGEYHTSTSVESAAGTPSFGSNCEKSRSTAASCQTGSSRTPSIFTSASTRGAVTCSCPLRPLNTRPVPDPPCTCALLDTTEAAAAWTDSRSARCMGPSRSGWMSKGYQIATAGDGGEFRRADARTEGQTDGRTGLPTLGEAEGPELLGASA